MLQHLVLTALGSYSPQLIEQLSKAMSDCGCNIQECRSTILGSECSVLMMVSGNWDAIAKLEDVLAKLENKLGMSFHFKRTSLRKVNGKLMPYAIDVVCCDRPGVVHEIASFIANNDIEIQDIHTHTYEASQTGTRMFSLHMTINIPTDMSLSTIRGDFLEFCDRLNLDAIMEPVK